MHESFHAKNFRNAYPYRHYFFSQPALLTGKHIDIPFTPEKLWKLGGRRLVSRLGRD